MDYRKRISSSSSPYHSHNDRYHKNKNKRNTNSTTKQRRQRAANGGWLRLKVRSIYEIAEQSLFYYPCLAVIVSIIFGLLCTRLDEYLTQQDYSIPTVLSTTVNSARTVLSTIAGATISFAGTAFSVSLLVIQLGSSSYTPRVVHTLFRDPYNKAVMAFVIGTFTYCLVVLRSVQEEEEESGNNSNNNDNEQLQRDARAIVPHISVAIATLLGILSLLAIVGFIDHAAHSMDISELLERVTLEAIERVQTLWVEDDGKDKKKTKKDINNNNEDDKNENRSDRGDDGHEEMDGFQKNRDLSNCHVVRFQRSGWVQEIDWLSLEELVEKDGFIELHTSPGRYAIPGVPICSVSHITTDSDETEKEYFDSLVHDAVAIGISRTNRDDPTYGLRQLVDVSLRALSPGINDPTTAQDAIFHTAAVVLEFLRRNPPAPVRETKTGGKLIVGEQPSLDSIVLLAYDEVRKCAATSPTVCVYLLESLRLIRESLTAEGFPINRAPEIERQAMLIEKGCLAVLSPQSILVEEDCDMIRTARTDRFPPLRPENINKSNLIVDAAL